MQTNYSVSEENYIKSIYRLQQYGGNVSTNELGRHLGTAPASVTDMMKKLQTKKLLLYTPYKGFRLSKLGNTVALGIVRRHRLWEFFLSEKLNFGWDEVHDIAEQLEHVSSPVLIDKLDAFLNYPPFDPHGDPIPDKSGNITTQKSVNLSSAPINKKLEICAVSEQGAGLLEILKNKKLAIGTQLSVRKKFDYDNSLEIKVNNGKIFSLSEKIAEVVFVKILK